MLPVSIALNAFVPFIPGLRLIRKARAWTAMALHLFLAGMVVPLAALGMMTVVCELCPPTTRMASGIYAVGLAVSICTSLLIGSATAPALWRAGFLKIGARLTAMVCIATYLSVTVAGLWRPGHVLYLVGCIAGTVAATAMLPRPALRTRLATIS
jgi:hypothetical protein